MAPTVKETELGSRGLGGGGVSGGEAAEVAGQRTRNIAANRGETDVSRALEVHRGFPSNLQLVLQLDQPRPVLRARERRIRKKQLE